eukprot:1940717-Pyramimonas_sp.AAC.1
MAQCSTDPVPPLPFSAFPPLFLPVFEGLAVRPTARKWPRPSAPACPICRGGPFGSVGSGSLPAANEEAPVPVLGRSGPMLRAPTRGGPQPPRHASFLVLRLL